jgi:glycosyltransferase involved in cell wall biosynthesis
MLEDIYSLGRVALIDTGVDLEYYAFSPPKPSNPPDIVFSGAKDSSTNIDGIEFLMNEISPLVAKARPDAEALIAGRNPAERLIAKARRLSLPWRFTGYVEDIRPEVLKGSVSVIPLRVGSGTRIKTFETMALGRPLVATSLGIEGLNIVPGRHFLLADTPAEFAAAVLQLIEDPALNSRIAHNARTHLEEQFSWTRVAKQFEDICAAEQRDLTAARGDSGWKAFEKSASTVRGRV